MKKQNILWAIVDKKTQEVVMPYITRESARFDLEFCKNAKVVKLTYKIVK